MIFVWFVQDETIIIAPGSVLDSAFETPATFHMVAKSHWKVQWFI